MKSSGVDTITAELLRSAVHDLAGPANRARLAAQLLAGKTCIDEDGRKLLGYIEGSAAAIHAVAEGLRCFGEICFRERNLDLLDLNLSAEAAMAGLQSEIESSGTKVTVSPLPVVKADAFQMTWLLQELLANAIRSGAGRAGAVELSEGKGGPGAWYISVSDDGPGIESGMEERIFQPFRKPGGDGVGMGLTICRKIVELHGGRIWVHPRKSGAEIRFFVAGRAERKDGAL